MGLSGESCAASRSPLAVPWGDPGHCGSGHCRSADWGDHRADDGAGGAHHRDNERDFWGDSSGQWDHPGDIGPVDDHFLVLHRAVATDHWQTAGGTQYLAFWFSSWLAKSVEWRADD